MAKITITLEDKAEGPMIRMEPDAKDLTRMVNEALPTLPSPATVYALVAIRAIGKMSRDASTAEGKLRGLGILLP